MSELVQDREQETQATEEVRISFSGEAYKILKEIAAQKNKPIEDVIEDALGLERWYQDIRKHGGRVIIEREDGVIKELVRD